MPKVSVETQKLRLSSRISQLAAADPWGIAARIRPECLDKILDCLVDSLPDAPSDHNINFSMGLIEERGDGSPFISRGAANAAHNSKLRGTDKMKPMTGEVREYLKGASAVERLRVANDEFPSHLETKKGPEKK